LSRYGIARVIIVIVIIIIIIIIIINVNDMRWRSGALVRKPTSSFT
jgi:hypothetical protein